MLTFSLITLDRNYLKTTALYHQTTTSLNVIPTEKVKHPEYLSEFDATRFNKRACFCGGSRHNCQHCPAKGAACDNYEKSGRFAIVSQSKPKSKKSSAAIYLTLATVDGNKNVIRA